MASYRFELNTKPNRNKQYNILLCITIAGKRKRVKTDIFLNDKKDFNPKTKRENWVRKSEPNYKVWNDALKTILDKAKESKTELDKKKIATAENVAKAVKDEAPSETFLKLDPEGMTGFAAERTQQILDEGGIRNWKIYVGFLNKLAGYLDTQHKKELLFSDITTEFVAGFYSYLGTLHNERSKVEVKLNDNTKATIMNKFKALMNHAFKLEKITADNNPFLKYEYKHDDKTTKEKLDEAEIDALQALELEEGSLDWHSRNCFMFSFYCAGMRAADVLLLRWKNVEGGKLNYTMSKNGKAVIDRDIVPQAAAILDLYRKEDSKPSDYIFPLMNSSKAYAETLAQVNISKLPSEVKQKLFEEISIKNAMLNKGLKRLAEKAGISKKLSMHIARHSFANKAMKEGIESSNIQGLLAHSSLSITEKYMGNFGNKEQNAALKKTFGTGKKAQLLKLIDSTDLSDEDISKLMASVLATINK